MSASSLSAPRKYIAEVRNSQEVSLYGSADLTFWTKQLLPEKLVPVEKNGQAQLMISAVASRWLGVPFSEFMIAVLANPVDHSPLVGSSPGMYLLTAYNTSRPFTFIEQRYFLTPYTHGVVQVECGQTPSFRLKLRPGEVVSAVRKSQFPLRPTVDEIWEGPIYLPPRPAKARLPGKLFYARLAGLTEISPFQTSEDSFCATATASDPVFGWLMESGFAGREWHIRSAATHARSQTYPRS